MENPKINIAATLLEKFEPFRIVMQDYRNSLNSRELQITSKTLDYVSNGLPQDIENLLTELMNQGWFIWFYDEYMSDFASIAASLIGKNTDAQDRYMEEYIDTNLSVIKARLIASYPSRQNQISDAFNTHEAGYYFSSTPAFLIIAEGIGLSLIHI